MHSRRHRRRGFGRPHGLGRGWYDREKVLERLEDYQRDLEQELADVSDLIKRLKAGEQEAETATV
jgi:cell division septum initiation protein DivIVA